MRVQTGYYEGGRSRPARLESIFVKSASAVYILLRAVRPKNGYLLLGACPRIRDMRGNPQPHPGIDTILTTTNNVSRNTVKCIPV